MTTPRGPAGCVAVAPGRVNLIGYHTDYTGGWALPMALDLRTTVTAERRGAFVVLESAQEEEPAVVPIDLTDPSQLPPGWGRYVGGVVAEVKPDVGAVGTVATTLPVGAGLSSSAALEVAVALALGHPGPPLELARACQRAEHRATGVPTGIMDQLVSAAAVEGAALLLDCRSFETTPVALPDLEVVVVHSGQSRQLAGSAYAERKAQAEEAEQLIGPLRDARLADVASITDPLLRRRARHVVSENVRVQAMVEAFAAGDVDAAGRLLVESHASLRDDFDVSTTALDSTVDRLLATPGVLGARLTGAGFGGCVVAFVRPGTDVNGWRVRPGGGAFVLERPISSPPEEGGAWASGEP